jgi:hypothetical protein
LTSSAMAWRDTQRMRAASAWEIHSSGESSIKCLDIDKIFMLPSNLDSTPNALIGKEARSETVHGTLWRRWWRRRIEFHPQCYHFTLGNPPHNRAKSHPTCGRRLTANTNPPVA